MQASKSRSRSTTPKDKSPKNVQRRSPRSLSAEEKYQTKVSELEVQLAQLHEELKMAKGQLLLSESTAKDELAATSAKLEATQDQLTETVCLLEELKCQLSNCENSESHALGLLTDTQVKLELTKTAEENFKVELIKSEEAYESVVFELEKLKSRVLEGENEGLNMFQLELIEAKTEVEQLKSELYLAEKRCKEENIQSTLLIRSTQEQAEKTKAELAERETELGAKLEIAKAVIEELKALLANKETDIESGERDSTELKKLKTENEALKVEIERMETDRKREKEESVALVDSARVEKAEIEELKVAYKETKDGSREKDTEEKTKKLEKENEALKAKLERVEIERKKEKEDADGLVEVVRASEREAMMKIGYLTEEADKMNRRVHNLAEQLETLQGTNGEIEAELRKLKVQSDQWRKAAEAAAVMISSGENGKFVERTGSFGKGYNTIGAKLGSPLSEDLDYELPKKKNGNMLRKLGLFLKKGQK